LDFIPVVSTTSPDDSLALLLALYSVFELNFNKNSRTIRLLYAIVFSDKRFISNTIRSFIHEKGIDIYSEINKKTSNDTNSAVNNSTIVDTDAKSSSPNQLNSSRLVTNDSPIHIDIGDSNVTTSTIPEK
jgi:hypothetical protein